MKKLIYALMLPLVVVSGLVFANRQMQQEDSTKSIPKTTTAICTNDELKKWEATPAGMQYKKWEASPGGKKVLAAAANLKNYITDSSNMEAVVTSLSLPPGSRLGFGLMARIKGEDYILSFGAETTGELERLRSLQVNDRIIIRSRSVSHAPKYAFPIVSGDYVEKDGKLIYKRAPRKGGC